MGKASVVYVQYTDYGEETAIYVNGTRMFGDDLIPAYDLLLGIAQACPDGIDTIRYFDLMDYNERAPFHIEELPWDKMREIPNLHWGVSVNG